MKQKWYKEVYYLFYRLWNDIIDVPKKIKWFYQRGKRGYADCDRWSIDYYLCSFMPQVLRDLAENIHGVPQQFVEKYPDDKYDYDVAFQKWKETILMMAEGFEAGHRALNNLYPEMEEFSKRIENKAFLESIQMDNKDILKPMWEKEKEDYEFFHERMKLFNKYFFNLWD